MIPPRTKTRTLQLNKLFESEQEMREQCGGRIVKSWTVTRWVCVIEVPEKVKKEKAKKK